ncbi:MAG: LssY C-terminal domain-containing protein [Minisyncoccota bacterium]
MTQFIASLLPTLQHLGVFGYWIILIFALLESLAFVGVIVPGAVAVVFAGVLSAQGYLDLGDLILFAAIGAILGDTISYHLGSRGKYLFRPESRFFKLSHLERGEQFFKRHGGKSIFLGRFIGPLRPIVPFIAGLSRMPMRTFLVWNISSGILWAAAHVLIGYVFGNILGVVEAWSSRVGLFLFGAAVLVFALWYGLSRSKPLFVLIASIRKSIARAIAENPDVLRFKEQHPRLVGFVQDRLDPRRFSGRTLTLLSLAMLYAFALLAGLVEDVIRSDSIVALDARVANLALAFRDLELLSFFTWVTFLGKWEMILAGLALFVFLLWLWRRGRFVFPLALAVAGAEVFTTLGKIIIHRPRPEIAYYIERGFSFPSGHATIAVAFYGFCAYMLVRSAHRWPRKVAYGIGVLFLIVLIGVSRVYLGVHYVSDVLAGYAVGLLWLLIAVSISEWMFSRHPDAFVPRLRKAGAITFGILLVWAVAYGVLGARYHPPRAVPTAQTFSTVRDAQSAFASGSIPLFTETVTGATQEPISIVLIAPDDASLVRALQKAGWLKADSPTLKNTLILAARALSNTSYPNAPMTPSFWDTRVHDLGFQKETAAQTVRSRHHARLWRTSLQTVDGQTIYVGTVSLDVGLKWGVTHAIDPNIDAERELLVQNLETAGVVHNTKKIQLVKPNLGENFSGDAFFTDGIAYIVTLR